MIWGRRAAQRATLVECLDELPPYGHILTLRPPARDSVLQSDAVLSGLRQYMQELTPGNEVAPFVGLLIDLMPKPYDFSDSDLTAVLATIAAWHRGWVIPAAVVLAEPASSALQNMLNVTKLSQIRALRVVPTVEAARVHILEILSDRPTGA
jgi:hypothetical protein